MNVSLFIVYLVGYLMCMCVYLHKWYCLSSGDKFGPPEIEFIRVDSFAE